MTGITTVTATVPATTAAETTTTASSATPESTTTTATAAAAAFFARTSFVDSQRTAIDFLAGELLDRGLGAFRRFHRHESKPA